MACNVAGSPPHSVIDPVENGQRNSTKHTTHPEARRFDLAPPGLNLVLRSTSKDGRESIGALEPGPENLGIGIDFGSRGLNPKCHGSDIIVRDWESAFYVLSKRP